MKYIALTSDGSIVCRENLADAKKAAEQMSRGHGKPVEIFSYIATCHPPEPQPCRWEDANGVEEHICDFHRAMDGTCMVCGKGESVKKSDRDYDRVPLGDLPAPPEGFAFYGHGPVAGSRTLLWSGDISWLDDRQAWIKNGDGTACRPYALRIGSDIARKNGIGGVE